MRQTPGMETPKLVLLCLLMAAEPVTCQQGLGNLEPWMQGLIAVAVFLALVAVAFAVNHFWCQEDPDPMTMVMSVGGKSDPNLAGMDGRYSPMALSFRSSEHKNAYENENVMEDIPGIRSTPM